MPELCRRIDLPGGPAGSSLADSICSSASGTGAALRATPPMTRRWVAREEEDGRELVTGLDSTGSSSTAVVSTASSGAAGAAASSGAAGAAVDVGRQSAGNASAGTGGMATLGQKHLERAEAEEGLELGDTAKGSEKTGGETSCSSSTEHSKLLMPKSMMSETKSSAKSSESGASKMNSWASASLCMSTSSTSTCAVEAAELPVLIRGFDSTAAASRALQRRPSSSSTSESNSRLAVTMASM
mmetsp:Transcript_60702/g.98274  ORF Transcript_60702/g.98274 Transcript_60702/m.98274 type:complete len:242 (-) Transcript_60702:574-1299(-)